jgi:hypothetical protein
MERQRRLKTRITIAIAASRILHVHAVSAVPPL